MNITRRNLALNKLIRTYSSLRKKIKIKFHYLFDTYGIAISKTKKDRTLQLQHLIVSVKQCSNLLLTQNRKKNAYLSLRQKMDDLFKYVPQLFSTCLSNFYDYHFRF